VYFVLRMSKQSPVLGPNRALVMYVVHFLLMTSGRHERGLKQRVSDLGKPHRYVPCRYFFSVAQVAGIGI
jgi:hypothetical protein